MYDCVELLATKRFVQESLRFEQALFADMTNEVKKAVEEKSLEEMISQLKARFDTTNFDSFTKEDLVSMILIDTQEISIKQIKELYVDLFMLQYERVFDKLEVPVVASRVTEFLLEEKIKQNVYD